MNICAGQESMPNLENAILGEEPENTTWTNKLDGGGRGDLTCMRAFALFFGSQTGKTEDTAGQIASAAGL